MSEEKKYINPLDMIDELRKRGWKAGLENNVVTVYLKAPTRPIFFKKRYVLQAFVSGIGFRGRWDAKYIPIKDEQEAAG